ncbi:peptide chain release factor N(5)-glutamine methyltransferase [Conchiformibius kuhniae]|uniref:Release factor glutamine methyltransferase n=1 Tax=Conchiformibius kuhniae TaxID=211502 RepID=A0A8T9MSS6_9NEIS|nr:peptide chain release factor N(5)-glutamine methyltransferase [Conchiformibius kuhniae]
MQALTVAEWANACPLGRLETRMLLSHITGRTHAQLVVRDGEGLSPPQQAWLADALQRRLAGEPMAYILGTRAFYGRDFAVSPAVLIPRPETEHLLEAALSRLPANGVLWDIGTGSGIIAVSAKLERADARVFASDICPHALAVAKQNAARLGADIAWAQGAWSDVQPVPPPCDVLVSNPPYIEADDPHLREGDLRFEPPHALTDFADGLTAYRRLAADAPRCLKTGGWLLVEHGYNQGEAVRGIFRQHGFDNIATERDWAGHERLTLGQLFPPP